MIPGLSRLDAYKRIKRGPYDRNDICTYDDHVYCMLFMGTKGFNTYRDSSGVGRVSCCDSALLVDIPDNVESCSESRQDELRDGHSTVRLLFYRGRKRRLWNLANTEVQIS